MAWHFPSKAAAAELCEIFPEQQRQQQKQTDPQHQDLWCGLVSQWCTTKSQGTPQLLTLWSGLQLLSGSPSAALTAALSVDAAAVAVARLNSCRTIAPAAEADAKPGHSVRSCGVACLSVEHLRGGAVRDKPKAQLLMLCSVVLHLLSGSASAAFGCCCWAHLLHNNSPSSRS